MPLNGLAHALLSALARPENHSGLGGSAAKDIGGYGAGLARHLATRRADHRARSAGPPGSTRRGEIGCDRRRPRRPRRGVTHTACPSQDRTRPGGVADAAHRPAGRGRSCHDRATTTPSAGHHRAGVDPGPVPRPVHPRDACHRDTAASCCEDGSGDSHHVVGAGGSGSTSPSNGSEAAERETRDPGNRGLWRPDLLAPSGVGPIENVPMRRGERGRPDVSQSRRRRRRAAAGW